jgi:AAHS family 3-hydroxyphenylpropionic acid transporter
MHSPDLRAGELRSGAVPRARIVTTLLCFLVAFAEGLDIQAFGIAAPGVRAAFNLSPGALGLLGSAGIVGLVTGSLFGGWLVDRWDRKRALIAAVSAFGLFTLLMGFAPSFEAMLAIRLLMGMALGGAVPNIIAQAAEAGEPRGRVSRITLVMSGTPFGGVAAGAFGATALAGDWQAIFVFGGVISLILVPFLIIGLPASAPVAKSGVAAIRERTTYVEALIGGNRLKPSALLWMAACATQLVLHLLMNWLPALLQDGGFERSQSSLAISVFHLAGGFGAIALGQMMQAAWRWIVPLSAYCAVVMDFIFIGHLRAESSFIYLCAAVAGGCLISGQLMVYGMAAEVYPHKFRATGVGVTTAVGRVGSTLGPVLGGVLVSTMGASATTVVPALIPFVAIAGACATLLARRPPQ